MDRSEKTVEKSHLDGRSSASLSADIWHDMQSNASRGRSDTGSLGGKSVAASSEAISRPVAKDNAKNKIPERNAAPNNLAADQGLHTVFIEAYQAN